MLNKRAAVLIASVAICFGGAAIAQDQDASSPAFDPTPFLTAMVEYRLLAFSCEEVLPGSPVSDSAEIAQFFIGLDQPPPSGSNEQMDRIAYELVRAQAASICSERLRDAAIAYGEQAILYDAERPPAWPLPPAINAGPWCSDEACSSLR